MRKVGKYYLENEMELTGGRCKATVFEDRKNEHGQAYRVCVATVVKQKHESWKAAIQRTIETGT